MCFFAKMSCAGNDFLFTFNKGITKEEIVSACNRNTGIGADGVVLIYKIKDDFAIKIYNADGSFANFCGNATLCTAKYLFEKGFVKKNKFIVHTDAGDKKVIVTGKLNYKKVRLEAGKPSFRTTKEYFLNQEAKNKLFRLFCGDEIIRFRASVVDVGNLHLVVLVADFNELRINKIISAINGSKLFSQGVNVEFVKYNGKTAKVVVYERGCGRTRACSSGATAVFWTLKNIYPLINELLIKFEGGKIFVKLINGKVNVFGVPRYEKL